MKFTVEEIEMNMVMITFATGEKYTYSLDGMDIPTMVREALYEYFDL